MHGSANCLIPSTEIGGRFSGALWRNLFFSFVVLLIEVPLGIAVALAMPRRGWAVGRCLVMIALPLLIPWNVVGTIWQIFARPDIGLLGATLNGLGLHYNDTQDPVSAWATIIVMDVWHWTPGRAVVLRRVEIDSGRLLPGGADRCAPPLGGVHRRSSCRRCNACC